jgi:glutathione synthase/RimK-type ligase-like ATP-grasp enzyme
MASNGSKPYQAAVIARHGFAIPETLITTDPAAARAFVQQHEAVIYKSISGVRSIVSRVTADDAARLDDVAWCPTQFQRYIPGRDFRVHIVGDAAFTAEVVSAADDYRYAARQALGTTVRAGQVPAVIRDQCHALAHSLELALAGIDLRLTPEGRWYCFEVNPSPAFTYYAAATGQPIAEAVAALLAARGA